MKFLEYSESILGGPKAWNSHSFLPRAWNPLHLLSLCSMDSNSNVPSPWKPQMRGPRSQTGGPRAWSPPHLQYLRSGGASSKVPSLWKYPEVSHSLSLSHHGRGLKSSKPLEVSRSFSQSYSLPSRPWAQKFQAFGSIQKFLTVLFSPITAVGSKVPSLWKYPEVSHSLILSHHGRGLKSSKPLEVSRSFSQSYSLPSRPWAQKFQAFGSVLVQSGSDPLELWFRRNPSRRNQLSGGRPIYGNYP
jgi:hypothetical protein